MADNYSDIDAIHEDYKKEKESSDTLVKKIPTNVKLIALGAIMACIWYFILTHNDWKKGLLIIAGILIAVYLFATSEEGGRRELTELELRTLLWKQLRFYQLNPFGNHYVVPDGEIKFLPNVARWTVGDQIKYRTFSVAIIKRNSLVDYYGCDVNVFTGDIMKIQEGYFTGRERPHIKYIESEDVARKKRYDQTLNVKRTAGAGGGVQP